MLGIHFLFLYQKTILRKINIFLDDFWISHMISWTFPSLPWIWICSTWISVCAMFRVCCTLWLMFWLLEYSFYASLFPYLLNVIVLILMRPGCQWNLMCFGLRYKEIEIYYFLHHGSKLIRQWYSWHLVDYFFMGAVTKTIGFTREYLFMLFVFKMEPTLLSISMLQFYFVIIWH